MSSSILTIQDIKDFLSSQQISWTGLFYNSKYMHYEEAKDNNFFDGVETNKTIKLEKRKKINICFTLYYFKIEDNDLTEEWQQFLLNRHGKAYSKYLYIWASLMCKHIDERNSLIVKMTNKQHLKPISKQPYEKNIEQAKQYLTPEEIEILNNN